jgi:hypothetical protein
MSKENNTDNTKNKNKATSLPHAPAMTKENNTESNKNKNKAIPALAHNQQQKQSNQLQQKYYITA